MKHKVIVNTLPHSGTHLIATILDIASFSHAKYFDWKTLSSKRIFINWRTSLLKENNGVEEISEKFHVSVASPSYVRSDLIQKKIKNISLNKYFISHIPYSKLFADILIDLDFRGISIIRDPRDVCISMLNHIGQRPHHYANNVLFHDTKNRYDRLKKIINGFDLYVNDIKRPFGNIIEMVKSILGWGKIDNFILLQFEDLVGPKGGGPADTQIQSIEKIFKHLDIDNIDVDKVTNNAFGKSGTFRKGQINRWKLELNEDEKHLFKEHDEFFISLGYEPTV